MENTYLYTIVLYYKKRLELIIEMGELLRDIMKDEELKEDEKLKQALFVMKHLEITEMIYSKKINSYKIPIEDDKKEIDDEIEVLYPLDLIECNGLFFEIILN